MNSPIGCLIAKEPPLAAARPDMLMKAPNWVRDVFEHYLICEFTSIDNGKPVTFPLLFFYNPNPPRFAVTSSILFSRKVEHMRKDPKVSLLFSNPEGSGIEKHVVLVQGVANCDDSDLDHGWERYLPMWRKKEPYIDGFLAAREQFAWFWKRIVIEVEPKNILAWKNGDTSKPAETISL